MPIPVAVFEVENSSEFSRNMCDKGKQMLFVL